jgi:hypothetical protein
MMAPQSVSIESQAMADFASQMDLARVDGRGAKIALRPDDVKNGLGKLVLTLIELLRNLLERQAIRRMESGSLTDLEIERLGTTFLQFSEQMGELKKSFGLEDADLNIDLGPLGQLL